MRRIVPVFSETKLFILTAVASLFLRSLASLGRPIARFPDTDGYESLQLTGNIDRLWPVPLMYTLVQSDIARVILHVAVGTGAWLWLAIVVSRITRWPRISFIVVVLLGLSPEVIRYDLAILSESLGISFAVFAFAMSIQLAMSPTRRTWFIWFLSIGLCAMTRPTHLLILVVILLPHIARCIGSKGRKIPLTMVGLFMLFMVGVVQVQANSSTSLLNFYTVLAERIVTDDNKYQWFVDRGMPDIAGTKEAWGYDYPSDLPPEVSAIVQLPTGQFPPKLMRVGGQELAQWATDKGWSTYLRYVVTHPADTASRLTSLTDSTLSPPNGDFLPLDNGPMLPAIAFGAWQLWGAVFVVATTLMFLRSSNHRLPALFIALGIIMVMIYGASTLTSGIEHPRHAVTVAVMVRVAGLTAILSALPRTSAWTNRDAPVDALR